MDIRPVLTIRDWLYLAALLLLLAVLGVIASLLITHVLAGLIGWSWPVFGGVLAGYVAGVSALMLVLWMAVDREARDV